MLVDRCFLNEDEVFRYLVDNKFIVKRVGLSDTQYLPIQFPGGEQPADAPNSMQAS